MKNNNTFKALYKLDISLFKNNEVIIESVGSVDGKENIETS